MDVNQRQKIRCTADKLGIEPEKVKQTISDALRIGGSAHHIEDCLAGLELIWTEFEGEVLGSAKIWQWFTSPIPALGTRSLLSVSLDKGIDPIYAYVRKIQYGDFS